MKKSLAVFLALLVFSAGALVFSYVDIGKTQNDVTLVTTDVLGDRAAAAGLRIETEEYTGQHLAWHTAHTVGDETSLRRTSAYSQELLTWQPPRTALVELTADISGTRYYYEPDGEVARFSGDPDWSRLMKDVGAEALPDGNSTKTVRLKDYYDYVPLGMGLYFTDANGASYANDSTVLNRLAEQVNEQIRIAVPGELWYKLTVHKNENGNLDYLTAEQNSIGADAELPIVETATALTPNAVYFVLKTRDANGTILDVSATENFGIYRIGTTGDLNGNSHFELDDFFTAAYPIDASRAEVLTLSASDDGRQLYLLTDEEGQIFLTVLDAATVTVTQKLPLMAAEENQRNCKVFAYEDFILCACGEEAMLNRFTLLSRTPDGALRQEFTDRLLTASDADSTAFPMSYMDYYSDYYGGKVTAAWKDGKLALTQSDGNGVSLAVYDKTGPLYLGYDKTNIDSEGLVYSNHVSYYHSSTVSITSAWE